MVAAVVAIGSVSHEAEAADAGEYDVVIYGPTSAGVAAAVQAKRMDKSVILVGPDKHLGGLSAGGLGWTDSGNKSVIGGVSLEFYKRVYNYYDKPETWKWQDRNAYGNRGQGTPAMDGNGRSMWVFEPHIAEQVFEDLIRDNKITVVRDEWLDRRPGKGVEMKDGRIQSITMLSGKTYRGKQFIDATYEGDLMAAAGCSYTVGREPNAKFDETLNGVQKGHKSHQFLHDISAYKTPGDPSSGLLPRVSPDPPGEQNAGDKRVQAYCFRMCLTRVPENRVPFPKPDGYDPAQYELLLRDLLAGSRHIKGKFDMIPNGKTDTNNHGSFSTDNIGMNYDYPEASYERRAEIIAEHRTYQQGYCYFLSNDPRVPQDVRDWYGAWGLAKDEFTDNGNWPHQIYVREARRMIGDLVVNENHLKHKIPTEHSIGMGSYNMDSHNVQRYVDENGFVRNEGDVQVNPGAPYPIDYGAIRPKKSECTNLLVPCAVSTTHIAFGSIRMEPVFMILGQSAATASCMSIDAGVAVQDLPYDKLSERLKADGQVLEYAGGRSAAAGGGGAKGLSAKKLDGVVVDEAEAKLTGSWELSTSQGPFVESGYHHDGNANKGKSTARFESKLKAGRYDVRVIYSPNPNRATNVPVTVIHAGGSATVQINERNDPTLDKVAVSVGKYEFDGDKPAVVEISNAGTDGYVIVDAVQFVSVK
ncbi:MAG: FAD-dependent oxidoreductase [Phycisphaera sp.]|nr:FAD-dependent oxidoreductase [Phycisphaera sp.]